MAKIKWDQQGERFYETGVSKGVLYVMNANGKTYDKGVAWNGLTNVSENPEGAEPNDLYADNIKYATLISAETFGCTIEAYTYPEEFNACDGNASPDGVAGVYVGQQPRRRFGFCYRTEVGNDTLAADDDSGYKLHIVYNCTATPSDKSYDSINDSPDAITFSWEVDTTPIEVTGMKPTATIVIDSLKADATKLAALEAMLYGSGDVDGTNDATLPDPDTVIDMMSDT